MKLNAGGHLNCFHKGSLALGYILTLVLALAIPNAGFASLCSQSASLPPESKEKNFCVNAQQLGEAKIIEFCKAMPETRDRVRREYSSFIRSGACSANLLPGNGSGQAGTVGDAAALQRNYAKMEAQTVMHLADKIGEVKKSSADGQTALYHLNQLNRSVAGQIVSKESQIASADASGDIQRTVALAREIRELRGNQALLQAAAAEIKAELETNRKFVASTKALLKAHAGQATEAVALNRSGRTAETDLGETPEESLPIDPGLRRALQEEKARIAAERTLSPSPTPQVQDPGFRRALADQKPPTNHSPSSIAEVFNPRFRDFLDPTPEAFGPPAPPMFGPPAPPVVSQAPFLSGSSVDSFASFEPSASLLDSSFRSLPNTELTLPPAALNTFPTMSNVPIGSGFVPAEDGSAVASGFFDNDSPFLGGVRTTNVVAVGGDAEGTQPLDPATHVFHPPPITQAPPGPAATNALAELTSPQDRADEVRGRLAPTGTVQTEIETNRLLADANSGAELGIPIGEPGVSGQFANTVVAAAPPVEEPQSRSAVVAETAPRNEIAYNDSAREPASNSNARTGATTDGSEAKRVASLDQATAEVRLETAFNQERQREFAKLAAEAEAELNAGGSVQLARLSGGIVAADEDRPETHSIEPETGVNYGSASRAPAPKDYASDGPSPAESVEGTDADEKFTFASGEEKEPTNSARPGNSEFAVVTTPTAVLWNQSDENAKNSIAAKELSEAELKLAEMRFDAKAPGAPRAAYRLDQFVDIDSRGPNSGEANTAPALEAGFDVLAGVAEIVALDAEVSRAEDEGAPSAETEEAAPLSDFVVGTIADTSINSAIAVATSETESPVQSAAARVSAEDESISSILARVFGFSEEPASDRSPAAIAVGPAESSVTGSEEVAPAAPATNGSEGKPDPAAPQLHDEDIDMRIRVKNDAPAVTIAPVAMNRQ